MIRTFSNSKYYGYVTNTFYGVTGIKELDWKTVERLLTEYYDGEVTTVGNEEEWPLALPVKQNLPNKEEWWKYRLSLQEWDFEDEVGSGRQPKCNVKKENGKLYYSLLQ